MSAILGQLLVDYVKLEVLFYISLGSYALAFILAVQFPHSKPREDATFAKLKVNSIIVYRD